MDIAMMNTTNDHGVGTQGVMGIASSSKPNGESSTFLSPSCSLSLIENDTETHFISTEEVIAFGGIPKPSAMLRSSNRLSGQSNVDMPIMEKAMENAQLHDDYFNSGKLATPKYSIVNIADVDIVKRAEKLGVSLGASQAEIDQSIRGIKLVEEERILTILKKNENDRENREEGLETLVLSKVSTLCEDLCEDDDIPLDFDDQLEHLKPVVKEKKNRH
jgi:hypothetical protein